ncbi:MAG: NAD(P)H-hydrate dehydratase [Xanthomonadaceae bacterium]|jgi:NAD(P)H-hydrate epimerase|nr:NAD(P)H-hydrate dehydratase [Xanthomonadaceae bacterium]
MNALFPTLYDAAAARVLDRRATELLGGDAYVLMQRAGQAAWRTVLDLWPEARGIDVVCGTGNNGGDGYVLARMALESGRRVRVIHLPDRGPRTELAQRACTEYLVAGGSVELFPTELSRSDLIVDALFGIGLDRAPDAALGGLIGAINESGCPVLALDVPSGLDADCGIAPGVAVYADCTLQFIVRHQGLYTGDALDYGGELRLDPLDVPDEAFGGVKAAATLLAPEHLAAWLYPRRRNSHKGESGRVFCIGGDHGGGGAVALCAEAALRSGAGLVSVATRIEHVPAILAQRPEAMAFAAQHVDDVVERLEWADVVAIGPGLGQHPWGAMLLAGVLDSGVDAVIDADALNMLASAPQALPQAVLTPHPGEAARLLGIGATDVQLDRFSAARALAEAYRGVVVLKGAGSLVVAPGLRPCVIGAGNPGMSTGGMGDLLTGVIAALRAQGLSAFDAACAGALLHGAAGDAAAEEDGERGLLPSDLLPWLRRLANPEMSD